MGRVKENFDLVAANEQLRREIGWLHEEVERPKTSCGHCGELEKAWEERDQLRKEVTSLREENLNFQDRMTEYCGPITDQERMELIRFRVSYPSLSRQYEDAMATITKLTGKDPRLPDREIP